MLKDIDPEIYEAIQDELTRQEEYLELIASENFASPAVLEAAGSVMTNKYAEGYPGARHYGGCEYVDVVERLAIERVKRLFGAEYANVQPHAGSQANMAVYFALLKPGDTLMGMDLKCGGHLTHGSKASFSGTLYGSVNYGVARDTERIDMAEVRDLALRHRPRMIVAGASAYPRAIDFDVFRDVADEVGAYLMVDIAHVAGLVVAGLHANPTPLADVVTGTSHKTMRGPRGGFILAKAEYGPAIDRWVFPGLQGGPLMHVIAAKAVSFKEAERRPFHEYQAQIIRNAKALAEGLMTRGYRLVTGGTDNHLMLIDLNSKDRHLTGATAEAVLHEAGITTNKNGIPFDPRPQSETSGLRLGTPAVTTRGMKETEMDLIAGWIDEVLSRPGDKTVRTRVREAVHELCVEFPIYVKGPRA